MVLISEVGVLSVVEALFIVFILVNAWIFFGTGWVNTSLLEANDWTLHVLTPLGGISEMNYVLFHSR